MTAVKSVSIPGIECLGGPLDGQRLEFDLPEVMVPLDNNDVNLRRWNLNDRQSINPVNCCAGVYVLAGGFYRWDHR